jgi:hypothetical protein
MELCPLPDQIHWIGHGMLKRSTPRGMSDYKRLNGNADYYADDGARLYRRCVATIVQWQAQFRGATSKWKAAPEDAMAEVIEMESKEPTA